MEPTLSVNSRFDRLDHENFVRMVTSETFKLFMARIRQEEERHLADCVALKEPAPLYRAQGAAQALRAIGKLPERIAGEMRKAGL